MGTNKKKIEVLWLVEHIAREMDVACAVKALARTRYGLDINIRNMYLHANQILQEYEPDVVVHPFFYFVSGALATEDYVKTWPTATHFNMAWEEIHYKAHKKIKAPSDDFTRMKVIHHAWGNFYKEYLEENGVPKEHVFVNGHPAYQLYKDPYKQYYTSKDRLAEKYGLDGSRKWIFVPENYRWAFIGNKIKLFTKLGADPDEIVRMRDFSIESLKQLLQWCNKAASDNQLEIIFRPRPSTNSQLIRDTFDNTVGQAAPNLHFIKDGSVREWILASDVVISSYSTSLIEAAIAGKPIYMVEPIPIPDSLYYDWYRYAPRIHSHEEFEAACLNNDGNNASVALKSWAESEMLSNGDPILGLVDCIKQLVDRREQINPVKGIDPGIHNKNKNYFNEATHENDTFNEEDIQNRVRAWDRILMNNQSAVNVEKEDLSSAEEKLRDISYEIVNKSMCRQDLLSSDAKPLIHDLNKLIRRMYNKGLTMSSWVGTLPSSLPPKRKTWPFFNRAVSKIFKQARHGTPDSAEAEALKRGMEQRLNYQPLPGAEDDLRIPWFLYWEIYWVLNITRPYLKEGMRIFDAGGTSSLFTCHMGSLGYEIHSVDLNEKLRENGVKAAEAMGWNMYSYAMNMRELEFPDQHFDHAYSICVFEHLDYDIKQDALAEIARCLKPGGIFSITFDYRNPAPGIAGYGKDTRPRNQLKTEEDIRRSFLSCDRFELIENQKFYDNKKSYLFHQRFGNTPYTFGAIFMRKVK